MHFSKASTYGIRSVAFMAARHERKMISIRELSRELDIPPAFLTKVMQRLASRNIVQTMRGYGGGVALGKPASEITLKEIITAVEGEEAFQPIGLGIPKEQMEKTPVFFRKWSNLNDSIDLFFSHTKLSELCPADGPGHADAAGSQTGSAGSSTESAGSQAGSTRSSTESTGSQAGSTGRTTEAAGTKAGSADSPAGGNTAESQDSSLRSYLR